MTQSVTVCPCASGCARCSRPEFQAKKREYRKRLYADRKLSQRCVDCAAGLQEDDGLRCVECTARNAISARRYREGNGRNREYESAKSRRLSRRSRGLCVKCDQPSSSQSMCPKHLALHRVLATNWARRKRAGILPIKRVVAVALPDRPEPYRPHDELRETPRVRILLALSWLDWPSSRELFDVLGIAWMESDPTEHDRFSGMLRNLVKAGAIEKRTLERSLASYRLTDAGRAEVAKIRSGNYVTTRRVA